MQIDLPHCLAVKNNYANKPFAFDLNRNLVNFQCSVELHAIKPSTFQNIERFKTVTKCERFNTNMCLKLFYSV